MRSGPADPSGPAEAPHGAGVPDAFGRLWTPHRLAYIQGAGKPTGPGAGEGCPFCVAPTLSDEESLIVARGELVYAILNLYPYNSGHVLICPYRHIADYTELTGEESAEFADYTMRAIRALRTASGPHGFNIGMNLGTVAGAGIAAHLHQHVVPRWGGDTNFMPVVGRTRVLPQLLADTRKLLADAWPGKLPAASSSTRRPAGARRPPRGPAGTLTHSGRESAATLAARCEGSGSCRRYPRVNDPVPCETERRSIEYRVISSSGTSARMSVRPMPTGSVPSTRPRLPDRSDMTAPTYSSGTRMDTSSTGSSSIGDAFSAASFKAARPAFWNAMSEESTECAFPSNSVTRTPVIG
jgi:ATP adenylyltransferase